MCVQIDLLFTCGHRSFHRFENCAQFGSTCFGAGGKHKDLPVEDICRDCKLKSKDPNPDGRKNDPYRKKK